MDHTYHPTAARRTFALVCGGFLAIGVILASLGPMLPYLAAQVGQDVAALGGVFTALSAGVILVQFGVGPASDRFGQRPVLAVGLLLIGSGALALTCSRHLLPLLACALLVGTGFGAVLTAGNLLVARLFPGRSVAALNGVNLFFGVGSILGPAVAGMAGARLGLPQVGLWMGAGILAVLAPVILRYAAAPALAQRDSTGPAGEPARASGIWLLGFLLLCYTGTEVGFGGWVTLYLISSADLVPETAALIASGFWLALTAGRGLGAVLGLRLTPQTLLTASLLGMLGGAALLSLSVGDRSGSVAGVLLLGLSCGPQSSRPYWRSSRRRRRGARR